MATVTNTIELPGGVTPSSASVEIELVASTTGRAAGWVDATDVTILHVYRPAVTDGAWTADLTPNADIDPSGTVYKVSEYVAGKRYIHYIEVGPSGGSVHDLLTAGPAGVLFDNVASEASTRAAADSALDARLDIVEAAAQVLVDGESMAAVAAKFAAISAGVPVVIPAGTYNLTGWTTLAPTGPLAVIADPEATISCATAAKDFVSSSSDVSISGGIWTGWQFVVSATAGAAPARVTLQNMRGDGIGHLYRASTSASVSMLRIVGCEVTDSTSLVQASFADLAGGYIAGNKVDDCQLGIYIHEVDEDSLAEMRGVSIVGNVITNLHTASGTSYGILCSAADSYIAGNYIESITSDGSPPNLDGIYLRNTGIKAIGNTLVGPLGGEGWVNVKADRCVVANNTFRQPSGAATAGPAIKLDHGIDQIVSGNRFENIPRYCIYTGSGSSNRNIRISNNIFRHESPTSDLEAAVYLLPSCSNVEVTNNTFDGVVALLVSATDATSNVVFADNRVMSARGGITAAASAPAVSVSGSGAISGLYVLRNFVSDCGRGVSFASGMTVTGLADGNYWGTVTSKVVNAPSGFPYVDQLVGAGAPSIAAPVGSTYRRSDGGATSTFYVKESGTSTSGWVAK